MFKASPGVSDFHSAVWDKMTRNRLAVLDAYLLKSGGLQPGTRILDFGAGHGAFSNHFSKQGMDVLPVDGRPESLEFMKREHGLAGVLCDLERDFPVIQGKGYFSLIIGLLYHLGHPENVLRKAAEVSDQVIVETVVLDHDGSAIVKIEEDSSPIGYSVTGRASRPSPGWIIDFMKQQGFDKVVDLSCEELNVAPEDGNTGCLYTWEFQRTCGWRRNEMQLRKMWAFRRA